MPDSHDLVQLKGAYSVYDYATWFDATRIMMGEGFYLE